VSGYLQLSTRYAVCSPSHTRLVPLLWKQLLLNVPRLTHGTTETAKSPVHDHEASRSHDRSRFVLQRWWRRLIRLIKPSRPGSVWALC
jgi:hypothetical protein